MTRFAALPLLMLSALNAQTADAAGQSYGVTTHEAVVRGIGPDYSARFEPHGVTFTPALGSRVEVPQSLQVTALTVRRGSTQLWRRGGDVPPFVVGNTVRYEHTTDLTETYDVRAEGIEQSFVFAQRPAGVGDLVVAVHVATELPLAAQHKDDVRYERGGAGGVAFGGVTGIDANGARAAGALRVVGDLLELSLPSAFVDSAAYPLVLDPMIGTTVTIGNGSPGIDRQPTVAFDKTTQRYLVVWNVELSATDAEVWAQFVTVLGNPIGNPILVDGNGRTGLRPAVANVNDSDRFLIVWGRAALQGSTSYTQARYASMAASNGVLTTSTHFAGSTTVTPTGIAVGGNSRESPSSTFEEALVVATLTGGTPPTSSAYAWPVLVPATGSAQSAGFLTQLYSGTDGFRSPAVSKHGGGARWMITVVRTVGLSTNVEASIVSLSGTLCHQTTVASGVFAGDTSVAAFNSVEFLVAYEDFIAGTITTVRCATGSCSSGSFTVGPAQDPVQAPGYHFNPEVECVGDKYVLSWETGATPISPRDIRVRGLSLVDGSPAGAIHYAGGAPTPLLAETGSAIASRWSGGDTASDEALVVWSSGVIVGRRFEATGTGTVTSLGGACGIPGLSDLATYTGTPALGTTFTIELLAPTSPVLALIVGFSQTPAACGPCTIVPSPDLLLAGAGPVLVNVPLDPNLIGFALFTQWLQLRPSGCPLLPDFGFSNTLKFTIAE